jgi:hypothetical protein
MNYYFSNIINPDLDLLTVEIIEGIIAPKFLRWDEKDLQLVVAFETELSLENKAILTTIIEDNT